MSFFASVQRDQSILPVALLMLLRIAYPLRIGYVYDDERETENKEDFILTKGCQSRSLIGATSVGRLGANYNYIDP